MTCNGTCWPVSYVVGTTPGRYHAVDGEVNVSNSVDMTVVRHIDVGFFILTEWERLVSVIVAL